MGYVHGLFEDHDEYVHQSFEDHDEFRARHHGNVQDSHPGVGVSDSVLLGKYTCNAVFLYMAKAVTGKGILGEAPAADKRKMLGKKFIEAWVKLFGIR